MYTARRRIVAVLMLALGTSPGLALDLELSPVELGDGGKVKFDNSSCEPADSLPFSPNSDEVDRFSLPHYDVYSRNGDIVLRKAFARYKFYVKQKEAGTVFECRINGLPSGPFLPQLADVTLYVVNEGGAKEPVAIRLPVFNLKSQAYLSYPPWEEPQEVEIGSGTEIPVKLHNLLKDWKVRVESVNLTSPQSHWAQADFLANGKEQFAPFEIAADHQSDKLTVKLAPKTWMTLSKALFSRPSQKKGEKLTASVDYTASLGLKDTETETLSVDIPVLLIPWWPLLFLAVTFGTFFGSLIPVLVKKQRRWKNWPSAFVASWVTAILGELLAMLLVWSNSEFRLFGLALDPFQLLPSAFIGILSGLLGFKSFDIVQGLIPGLGKPATAAEEKG